MCPGVIISHIFSYIFYFIFLNFIANFNAYQLNNYNIHLLYIEPDLGEDEPGHLPWKS